MRLLTALVAAVLALATPAAAHITVTADPVADPVVVGQPFNVTVRFSEPCFEMPVEVAAGNDALTAALDATAPAYAQAIAGETVAWTIEDCEPSADPTQFGSQVRKAARLTVLVDASAPGLGNFTVPVNYVDANGGSGEPARVDVRVAYHANGTLAAAKASGHGTHAGQAAAHNGTAIALTLEYSTNAESLLTFEAATTAGEVREIDAIAVSPPSFENKTSGEVEAIALFEPPAGWDTASITFTAYLTPTVGGARVPVGNATIDLANEGSTPHGDDAHGDHEHEEEGAPAPAFALLALALLALAARRR